MYVIASRSSMRILTASPHSSPSPPKFIEKAKFSTTGTPCGAMTVLSPSTVAIPMYSPAQIEVWDWRTGKCVKTLTGFSTYVFANAVLPDGQLVAGDWGGSIRVGSLDSWAATSAIANGSGLTGVLAGHDRSFITADYAGNIKLWRSGACEVTLTGGMAGGSVYFIGVPVAVIGRRFVAVGNSNNLLVTE